MNKQITIPNVDIVEQAKKIGSEDADDLAVMQYIAQAAAAAQLVRIRKYFDDRTSEGFVQSWNLTVTPVVQEIVLDYPAQSFYIINDWGSPIFVEINRRHKTASQLNITEDMPLNFETHKLKRFYVYCSPGGAARARAYAKR